MVLTIEEMLTRYLILTYAESAVNLTLQNESYINFL